MSRPYFKNVLVFCLGIPTAILAAVIDTFVIKKFGFSLFKWSLNFFPVGAAIYGLIATSGLYLGAVRLGQKSKKLFFIEVAVIALLTQVLMYIPGYISFISELGSFAGKISVLDYVQIIMKNDRLRMYGIAPTSGDGIELGNFSYLLAFLRFLGTWAGGYLFYMVLRSKSYCDTCGAYMKSCNSNIVKNFSDISAFHAFSNALQAQRKFSPDFMALLHIPMRAAPSLIMWVFSLNACPKCDKEILVQQVRMRQGKSWKTVNELSSTEWVPDSLSMRDSFQRR